jgi:hypothetical protein
MLRSRPFSEIYEKRSPVMCDNNIFYRFVKKNPIPCHLLFPRQNFQKKYLPRLEVIKKMITFQVKDGPQHKIIILNRYNSCGINL